VDARERWQALQGHLGAARTFLSNDDTAGAIRELDAALAIDPEFLAARVLRDRLTAPALPRTEAAAAAPEGASASTPTPPLVSAEGYARFEQRARRRRIDRRAEAAREAIARGRLRDATSAIDEIRDLDPDAPEILWLTAIRDAARDSRRARTHWGPQIAAAAAFAAMVLGASWLEQQPRALLSYPMSMVAALIATAEPAPVEANGTNGTNGASAANDAIEQPERNTEAVAATSGLARVVDTPELKTAAEPLPATTTPPTTNAAEILAAPPPVTTSGPVPAAAPPPSAVAAEPPAMPPTIPASREVALPPAPQVDEDALIRRTLQQYRTAYDGLDAQSAQAVWPAVNERALARAFDGLESQRLTFDVCEVQVNGDSAFASCRGSARYVAKVGSREPRVEPLVWNFTLRKLGAEWKIESARAQR